MPTISELAEEVPWFDLCYAPHLDGGFVGAYATTEEWWVLNVLFHDTDTPHKFEGRDGEELIQLALSRARNVPKPVKAVAKKIPTSQNQPPTKKKIIKRRSS